MNVLVTGGLGFIGSTISEKLLEKGHDVVIVDSLIRGGVANNAKRVPKATVYKGDIRTSFYNEDIQNIECIIHCAANPGIGVSLKDPLFDFDVNARGTLNMLELARRNDASFIYCSTNKVYPKRVFNEVGLTEGRNRYYYDEHVLDFGKNKYTQDICGDEHTPYGCSKLVGDLYCSEYFHTYGVKTIVNRMSCIYGTHQYGTEEQGWISHFIRSALRNEPVTIYGNGKQVRDILWGEDLAELVLMEMRGANTLGGKGFNVGGGPSFSLSLRELVTIIEQKLEVPMKLNYGEWRKADQKYYVSDIDDVVLRTGWSPTVRPNRGVDMLIDWYKNNDI